MACKQGLFLQVIGFSQNLPVQEELQIQNEPPFARHVPPLRQTSSWHNGALSHKRPVIWKNLHAKQWFCKKWLAFVSNLPANPGWQEQLMFPLTMLHNPLFLHGLLAHKDVALQLGYSPVNSDLHTHVAPFIGSMENITLLLGFYNIDVRKTSQTKQTASQTISYFWILLKLFKKIW